jgi:two-component system OmpR family response regulator
MGVDDDEESILDAVTTALRYEGFEVRGATNAHDALAGIADGVPDLIVLDWMLPDLSEAVSSMPLPTIARGYCRSL